MVKWGGEGLRRAESLGRAEKKDKGSVRGLN